MAVYLLNTVMQKVCLGDDSVILVMNTINGNPNKIPDLLPLRLSSKS